MKTVATNHAPAALGPYAQAQISGGFVFTSGQIGIDPATGVIADGIDAGLPLCLHDLLGYRAVADRCADPIDSLAQ